VCYSITLLGGSLVKKSIAVGIILLFLLSSLIPVVSSNKLNSNRVVHVDDDIEIKIYAGVNGKTKDRMGLGWVISICNNLNETINGTIEISSDNIRGQNVRLELWLFNLSVYHPPVIFYDIDWIHFPFPINTLTITVETVDIIVSRSGIEIGPFVIFNQGED